MKRLLLSYILIGATTLCAIGQVTYHLSGKESTIVEEIKQLYAVEQKLILDQDTVGMKKFYPEDFVVTNPFNQFINKQKVIERVKGNIIKYSSYERKFDYFKFDGNTAIVIGSEIVIPTQDADRLDAGKTVKRRFTEIWMKRGLEWIVW